MENVLTRIDFRSTPVKSRSLRRHETQSLVTWHQQVRKTDALGFLQSMVQGRATIAGYNIVVSSSRPTEPERPYADGSFNVFEETRGIPFGAGRGPGLRYSSYDNRVMDLLEEAGGRDLVDTQLRSSRQPFDGLTGLVRDFVGHKEAWSPNDRMCIAEVWAPLEARIDELSCSLADGTLTVGVFVSAGVVLRDCDVGVVLSGKRGWIRSLRVPLPRSGVAGRPRGLAKTVSVPRDATEAALMLRVSSWTAGRHVAVKGRPSELTLRAAYDVVDPSLHGFTEAIKRPPRGRAFEELVCQTFALCGFHAVTLGGTVADAIDVLAYARSPNLLFAIECTSETLNSRGKLGKLVARAARLRAARIAEKVLPVIFSALPRGEISLADRGAAEADGVVVLCLEELQLLAGAAVSGWPLDMTVWHLENRIPVSQKP